ncbi:MAG: Hpt domain-containing protein, partial [Acidimicrobiales bacterium]
MTVQYGSMDEVVQEFLVESLENLDELDNDLVRLEKDPASRELLSSVFRAVHTIKGTTGFLGFHRLEQVAHQAENLLSKLRDGALQLDADRTTGCR